MEPAQAIGWHHGGFIWFFKFAYPIIFAACNICYIIYDEHSLFREGDGLQQAGQSRSPVVIVWPTVTKQEHRVSVTLSTRRKMVLACYSTDALTHSILRMRAKQPSTRSACAGSWMESVLTAGLTSRQSIRLGSLSPLVGPPFRLVFAELLFRSSSTRISLELTTEGGGESGREDVGEEMGMVGATGLVGAGGGGWGGLGVVESGRMVAGGGVGGSGRSRRSGIGGLRSFCCWQPFRISFRLGELSRLQRAREENIGHAGERAWKSVSADERRRWGAAGGRSDVSWSDSSFVG